MKDTEIISKLNKLLSYAEICTSDLSFGDRKRCVVHFSHRVEEIQDMVTFRIIAEHYNLYKEVFWALFSKGCLKENYTLKNVEDELNNYLFELKLKNDTVTEKNFNKFFNRLNLAPKKNMSVFHPIYGMDVTHDEPVKIGCFTFYNYELHKKSILSIMGFQSEEEFLELHREFKNHNIWISVDVETVNSDKAYEVACARFEVLQGLCQFIFDIEGYNAHMVCILSDVQSLFSSFYIVCESETGYRGEGDIRRFEKIDITNLIYDKNNLFCTLIEKIFVSENSEILNRIRNAFTTYGRILYERADAQKFAMYITTIESLVEYNKTELTELISKYVSAMISDNHSSYIATKTDFKRLYELRSEISHGSRTNILKGDLEYAKVYTVELIRKFVADSEILTFKNNKELTAHLDNKVTRLDVDN